jgi:hypothetical protein
MQSVPKYHVVVEEALKFKRGEKSRYYMVEPLLEDLRASLRHAVQEEGRDVQLILTPKFEADLHVVEVKDTIAKLGWFASGEAGQDADLLTLIQEVKGAISAASVHRPMNSFLAKAEHLAILAWQEQIRRDLQAIRDCLQVENWPEGMLGDVRYSARTTIQNAVGVDIQPLKKALIQLNEEVQRRRNGY